MVLTLRRYSRFGTFFCGGWAKLASVNPVNYIVGLKGSHWVNHQGTGMEDFFGSDQCKHEVRKLSCAKERQWAFSAAAERLETCQQ